MDHRSPGKSNVEPFLAEVFPALSVAAISDLARISLPIHFEEDELIAQEGSYASGIYVVRGRVGEYREVLQPAPRQANAAIPRGRGDGSAWRPCSSRETPINVQYAKAVVESSLVFFERSNILAFSTEYPRIFKDLCRWLAREVIMLEFKLTREAVESMDRNLALLLLALGNKYGAREGDASRLDLPISRQTMAEMVGVSVETLMRGLKRFRELGLVSTDHGSIWIRDPDGLAERARVSEFYLSIMEETL